METAALTSAPPVANPVMPAKVKQKAKKDLIDRAMDYVGTRDGAKDVFSAIGDIGEWSHHLGLLESTAATRGFSLPANMMNFLLLPEYMNAARHNISALCTGDTGKIPRVAYDVLNVASQSSDSALFLHEIGVIDVNGWQQPLNWFYQGSSFVLYGWHAIEQLQKIDHYRTAKGECASDTRVKLYDKKVELALVNIAVDVAAMALALFSMVSLVFGTPLALSLISLGFSSLYLILCAAEFLYRSSVSEYKSENEALLVKV